MGKLMDWKKLGDEDINGVFWVYGTYPESYADVNDYGETIGEYTGEMKEFVALAYIEFEKGIGIHILEQISSDTGIIYDDYCVSHYASFNIPEFPKEKEYSMSDCKKI